MEWAPVLPYWSVLWRSGIALARELASASLAGLRVVELGCGLGAPSLAAARAGAAVLATDACGEALGLLGRNARENGLRVSTVRAGWSSPGSVVERGPFDLVLASDVLYERSSVDGLLSLLPRLADEAWLADPGRPVCRELLKRAHDAWAVTTTTRDGIDIHRLTARRASPRSPARAPRAGSRP